MMRREEGRREEGRRKTQQIGRFVPCRRAGPCWGSVTRMMKMATRKRTLTSSRRLTPTLATLRGVLAGARARLLPRPQVCDV
jgi:hypothetical protein